MTVTPESVRALIETMPSIIEAVIPSLSAMRVTRCVVVLIFLPKMEILPFSVRLEKNGVHKTV